MLAVLDLYLDILLLKIKKYFQPNLFWSAVSIALRTSTRVDSIFLSCAGSISRCVAASKNYKNRRKFKFVALTEFLFVDHRVVGGIFVEECQQIVDGRVCDTIHEMSLYVHQQNAFTLLDALKADFIFA